MTTVDRWTDSLNLWIAAAQARGHRKQAAREMLRDAQSRDPNPLSFNAYIVSVLVGWQGLMFMSAALAGLLAFAGDRIGGAEGNAIGLALGVVPFAACLIGSADAAWRYWYAKKARRLFIEADESLDASMLRLLRIARTRDGTIVLQTVGGLVAGIFVLAH